MCEPRQVWTWPTCTGAFEVADVEDADTAEARSRVGRRGQRAVLLGARLLDRHEQQVLVDRHVALAARADDSGLQRRGRRVRDVVDLEAVEVADERVVALEGHVGVDEAEVAGVGRVEPARRLVQMRQQIHALAGDAGVVEPRREADAWIGRVGQLSRRTCRQHPHQQQHPAQKTAEFPHRLTGAERRPKTLRHLLLLRSPTMDPGQTGVRSYSPRMGKGNSQLGTRWVVIASRRSGPARRLRRL